MHTYLSSFKIYRETVTDTLTYFQMLIISYENKLRSDLSYKTHIIYTQIYKIKF